MTNNKFRHYLKLAMSWIDHLCPHPILFYSNINIGGRMLLELYLEDYGDLSFDYFSKHP